MKFADIGHGSYLDFASLVVYCSGLDGLKGVYMLLDFNLYFIAASFMSLSSSLMLDKTNS